MHSRKLREVLLSHTCHASTASIGRWLDNELLLPCFVPWYEYLIFVITTCTHLRLQSYKKSLNYANLFYVFVHFYFIFSRSCVETIMRKLRTRLRHSFLCHLLPKPDSKGSGFFVFLIVKELQKKCKKDSFEVCIFGIFSLPLH